MPIQMMEMESIISFYNVYNDLIFIHFRFRLSLISIDLQILLQTLRLRSVRLLLVPDLWSRVGQELPN